MTATNGLCDYFLEVEVPVISDLSGSYIINSEPACGQPNGSVTLSVTNGGGDYTYDWSDGVFGENRDDLSSGQYGITVIDNTNGCTDDFSLVLQDNITGGDLTITQTTPISCFGFNDGTVTSNFTPLTGFNGPEVYIISDLSGATFSSNNLPAGDFVISIYDQSNCLATSAEFTIDGQLPLEVNSTVVAADCSDSGSISLDISGGTPPYNIVWGDLTGANQPATRTDLAGGNYQVTISDLNNCQVELSNIFVDKNCAADCTEPQLVNTVVQNADCGVANGAIEIVMNL